MVLQVGVHLLAWSVAFSWSVLVVCSHGPSSLVVFKSSLLAVPTTAVYSGLHWLLQTFERNFDNNVIKIILSLKYFHLNSNIGNEY